MSKCGINQYNLLLQKSDILSDRFVMSNKRLVQENPRTFLNATETYVKGRDLWRKRYLVRQIDY